jgi:hypothetical protein
MFQSPMDQLVGHHLHFNLQLTGWLKYVSITNGLAGGPPSLFQFPMGKLV